MESNPDRHDEAPAEDPSGEGHGVSDALRSAVRDTLAATSGSAAQTRDRAGNLIDDLVRRGRAELERGRQEAGQLARRGQEATGEIARRGQEATGELARRGQEAGGEIAKRGGDARDELARRFEAFEARLASIEELLRRPQDDGDAVGRGGDATPKPDPGTAEPAASEPRPDPRDPGVEGETGTSSKPEVED